MSFKPSCGCINHDEFSSKSTFSLKKLEQRPFKKDIVDFLISKGILSKKSKYLCTACASYTEKELISKEKEGAESCSPSQRSKISVDEVIKCIQAGEVDERELTILASSIGETQKKAITEEAKSTTSSYINSLESLNLTLHTNVVVMAFLMAVAGIPDINTCSRKKLVALKASFDCLLSAANTCTITPLFFLVNLISYFICGSRTVISFFSSVTPSGSYSSILNWFKGKTFEKIKCIENCDLITYFDNSQILAKNWRVRYKAKALLSVITSVVHIKPAYDSFHQRIKDLSPISWLYSNKPSHDVIAGKIRTFIEKCSKTFEPYRDKFISERINKVYGEHVDSSHDIVDDALNNNPDIEIPSTPTRADPYQFIKHNHPTTPPTVLLGEPCMKNPCSYDAVKTVLEQLLTECSVGANREWTTIGCDGLPYLLASRLIEKNENLQNILIQPGQGHYEINMLKGCFKLLWDVALCDLAKILHYNTIRAQVACKNANDHHKAWQMLEIFLYATADELVVPFVRECIASDVIPSVEKFYVWLSSVKDPNYLFMKDMVFTYVYSLIVFRAGIRRNNSDVIISSRSKFSALFYGLNMTGYQEIDIRDITMRVLAPPSVSEHLNKNESFSTSGHPSKGEGGDFVLENKNRRLKMLIPAGVPSENRWLRVCRSFDVLDQIRGNAASCFGITEHDTDRIYHADLSDEKMQWRKKIRSVDYFKDPLQQRDHLSISSQPLDEGLVSFSSHCKGNRELYLDDIAKGLQIGKGERLTPVFITKGDREQFRSIRNKTMDEIKTIILREIDQIRGIGNIDQADRLKNMWDRQVKTQNKDAYIMFYRSEVLVVLDDVVDNHPLLGEDPDAETADS